MTIVPLAQIIDLKESEGLLDHAAIAEHPRDYALLSRHSWTGGTYPKRFARRIADNAWIHDTTRPHWEGRIVVDLGAGISTAGAYLAAAARARAYVAVDHHNSPYLLQKLAEREISKGPMLISFVLEDMVRFLLRLPEHSVNILACGIDRCMIPEQQTIPPQLTGKTPHTTYLIALQHEIARTLHPEGAMLTICSGLRPPHTEIQKFGDLEIVVPCTSARLHAP